MDLRNHGDSPDSEVMNYEVLADDLLEFICDRQLEKVSFIGHSMGGKSAMRVALREPSVVDGLVAIDAVPTLKRSIEHVRGGGTNPAMAGPLFRMCTFASRLLAPTSGIGV